MPAKQPSISDIARQLGLSVSGVSRALNNDPRISDATRQRVQAAAAAMQYQPNHMAVGLRRGSSKLLGVIVPYIDGRFFAVIIKGIEVAARQAGYSVIICQSSEDEAHERDNIDTLLRAQVDGILVSLARTTHDFAHFEKVRQRGVALVFFDRVLPGSDVNAVVLDDYAGGFRATEHLLSQGYRRIAHLAGPQHLNIYEQRRLGYLGALQVAGRPGEQSLVVYCDPLTLDTGRAAMVQLLAEAQPPDAVFSASDAAVVGAQQILALRGLRVPQDVGLVGFSNETFTSLLTPMLSSVEQHGEPMGAAAVRLFLRMQQQRPPGDFQRIVLQPDLLVRASSLREG